MNLKKIAVAVNTITFSMLGFAADYTQVTGSQNFNNNDTAQTISTNSTDVINVTSGGIIIQNNGNGSVGYRGIVDLNGGTAKLGVGSTINATDISGASQASGLAVGNAFNASDTTTVTAKDLTINVNNNANVSSVSGISLSQGNNTVNLDGLTTITVNSQNNAFSSGGMFFTTGPSVTGIDSSNFNSSGQINADGLNIIVMADNPSDNNRATGIALGSPGTGQTKLTYNSATIDVTSKQNTVGAHGMVITDGGTVDGKNTNIKVTGGTKGTIDQDLYGISLTGNTSQVDLDGSTIISIKSGDDDIWMTGISTSGDTAKFSQKGGLTINLDTNGHIDNTVYGIRASSSNNHGQDNVSAILTNLQINSIGDASSNSAYIEASGGLVNITTDNLSLGANAANSGEMALSAKNNGEISLTSLNSTSLTGNLVANQGTINFSGANGTLTGQAITSNSGSINLGLSNSMTWQMTGNSTVSQLNMLNSTVDFASYAQSGNYAKLSVGDLASSQNATFKMNVDIVGGQGDLLEITNSSSGNYALVIANQGNSNTTGTEVINVVDDQSATPSATFTSNTVGLGGYQYGLQAAGRNWQLTPTGKLTNAAGASANFLNTNYLLTYVDTQTLLQRMGELRAKEGQEGSFWMRGFAGKLNSFSSHKLDGFDMSYNGVQLGIDKLIASKRGDFYLGAMVGYTDADPDYRQGSGGVRDVNAGIYGTYIDNSGLYIDAIAKYTRIKNNFSTNDSLGQKVSGKAKTDGYGLSLELGKRFILGSSNFYLEPQAQLSYSHQNGDTVNATNGLKVKLDSYDSLLGRGSLIAGYQVKQGDNPIDVYVKSGYVREFKGNTAYYLNNNKEKHNFKGGWVDSAVGVTAQFNKHHNVYAEISYANGNRFDKQQANIGYRFKF